MEIPVKRRVARGGGWGGKARTVKQSGCICLAELSIISEYENSLQFDEKCLSIMLAEWEANPLICPVCTK